MGTQNHHYVFDDLHIYKRTALLQSEPYLERFYEGKTKAFHNAGFQINYLFSIGKTNAVFIFNTNNLFGSNQVYTYRFASTKNADGVYARSQLRQWQKRFFFIGIYLSMGTDRRKEVIDN